MYTKEQFIKIMEVIENCHKKEEKINASLCTVFDCNGLWSPYCDLVDVLFRDFQEQFREFVDDDFFNWWLFECYDTPEQRHLYENLPEGKTKDISIETPQLLADYLFND